MIHSASSLSSSAARSIAIAASTNGSASKAQPKAIDQIHIDKAAALRTNLEQVPEIRAEVVERAKALASDPTYPSDNIIRQIGRAIVESPDLSEELS